MNKSTLHENMTGVVHVIEATQKLPHDQDFYDLQAADQRRDLLFQIRAFSITFAHFMTRWA